MKKYDAIIIGFGKGGKTLAGSLASQGKNVALVEMNAKMFGGTCINIGCIPSKILVEESERKLMNYEEAIDWKRTLVSKLREANYNKLNAFENVDIYVGVASFVDEHTINVQIDNKQIPLQADLIFINTGAKEVMPNIKGIKETKNVYTSTTIMELDKLPKRLAILGGGYIGLEFASIYSNFGSHVSILEANEDILVREEQEIQKTIKQNFSERSIDVLTSTRIFEIKNINDNEIEIIFDHDGANSKLVVDGLLIASGRRPNIKSLNLDKANIKYTEFGIEVNEFLQTSVPHIYAIGDVKGGLQFTYISLDDFRIVKNHLLGNKSMSTATRQIIPYSLFISPTLARVGLTESEAISKGYNVKTKVIKTSSVPGAKILHSENGLLKSVIDQETGLILGCTLYVAKANEVINLVAMAMREKKHFSYLRDFIFTHPTIAEALNDLFDF